MNPGSVTRGLVLTGLLLALANTPAGAESPWNLSGDVRAGYTASWRDQRDGTETSADNFRARIRVRLSRDFGAGWHFAARAAGSYASDQDRFDFFLKRERPTGTGVEAGDTTLDELYLGYRAPDERWSVRAGRFQTAFNLPTVPAKSLDRNDSSSFNIGWTDGAHLQGLITPAWRGHLIAQANGRNGAGNTVRFPLDFADSDSRQSLFAGLEAVENPGPLVLRMIGLTWMPAALASRGIGQPARDDYVTLTAKLGAAWTLNAAGMRLVASGEAGHAFNRPRREVIGLTGADEVSGNAFQVSASLYDIHPGHHLGLVYGRAQPGWLISNDYRNNDELAEIRYQYRFLPQHALEARFRWRRELELPAGIDQPRRDRDIYVRITSRF